MVENKVDQLRVRLTKAEREALDDLIRRRGKGETVSDIVRQALALQLNPEAGRQPVYISSKAKQALGLLAGELKRDEGQVMEDCLVGILDIVDGHDGLVVQEIKLRRSHSSR